MRRLRPPLPLFPTHGLDAADPDEVTTPRPAPTLMFSDMEGSAPMTEQLGDEAAHALMEVHHAIVRTQVAAHGGLEIEVLGDGFLLLFAGPIDGVRCAVAIQQADEELMTAIVEVLASVVARLRGTGST